MPKYKVRVKIDDIEIDIAGDNQDAIDIVCEMIDDGALHVRTEYAEVLSVTALPEAVEKALKPIVLSEGND